jgi:hypothetical protein
MIAPDVTRSDWSARPPKTPHAKVVHHMLEVHHAVTPNNDSISTALRVKRIQDAHMNTNGWNDVFYNLFIARDGTIVEGRGWGNRSVGTALTVCLLGTYTVEPPTRAQQDVLRQMRLSLPPQWPITYHKERAAGTKFASECPGAAAISWVRLWRMESSRPAPPPVIPPSHDLEVPMFVAFDTVLNQGWIVSESQGTARPLGNPQPYISAGVPTYRAPHWRRVLVDLGFKFVNAN